MGKGRKSLTDDEIEFQRLIKNRARPKVLTAMLRLKLEEAVMQDGEVKTRAEVIADALLNEAMEGKPWAIKEVFDRVEGKPVQQTEIQAQIDEVEEGIEDPKELLKARINLLKERMDHEEKERQERISVSGLLTGGTAELPSDHPEALPRAN